MSFKEWYWKYVKEPGLHIDEDMAIAMYNAAFDHGYGEGVEDQGRHEDRMKNDF